MTHPWSDLLDRFVAVGLACGMGTEEEGLGFAVVEAHETMLPVADVVAKAHVEHDVAEVEAVEVEPESVDNAVSFV